MEIADMNDFEIRAELDRRQKLREQAEQERRRSVADFILNACMNDKYRALILKEASTCLSKSDYDWLISNFATNIQDYRIDIGFTYSKHRPSNG